ncbi:S-layer homology domain-containing protein [Bengtsoniella intestinalis]|uniref:S-layer homology domain-containing protein n=1 Tax=Bengtsoniella intestinalis TaxID=3073143 RepID=UPI00391F1CC3
MKKFLSLALALVMTMSLVTISASASFSDDASITYEEAVDVMYAMEIISGYTDGSFDPTATLTRGAACKIICNLILGPTTAGALGADAAVFPDVSADHVFAGYIAYCAKEGIVSGYSNGYFYPSNEVTGFQFMKMLLGALGYDSTIEGFTGDNWSVSVAKLAVSMGLEDGNEDYVGSVALTREEACLYALNTLEATMVEYDSTTSIVVGDISISTSSTYSKVTNEKSDDYRGSDDGDLYMQFCEEYFTKLEKTVDDTDAFGRPAVTWEYDGDDIGTYVDYDNLVESFVGNTTKDDIFEAITEDVYDDLDQSDDEENYLTVYIDGYLIDEDDFDIDDFVKEDSSTKVALRGSNTDVFVDDDDNVTICIINTYLVEAADDYDDDDEELDIDEVDDNYYADFISTKYASIFDGSDDSDYSDSLQSSIDNDDVYVEDFEDGDYILVTISKGDIQTAVLAETITGEVTTYTSGTSVSVDGSKYYYSANCEDTTASFDVGEDATLVLDEQGNVIYVDEAVVAADRYVFVDEFDTNENFSSTTYYAAAYFADGTYAEIELDEVYDDDADDEFDDEDDANTNYSKQWYAYTTNSDGTYDLCEVEDDYMDDDGNVVLYHATSASSEYLVQNGTVQFAKDATIDGSNIIRGDSDTLFVIVDEDGDVFVYTGISNVPDIDGKGELWALMDGSYAAFVFVDASEADIDGSGNSASDYMFVLDYDGKTVDSNNDTVYEYTVLLDGEETDIISEISLTVGMLYGGLEETSDGYFSDADRIYNDPSDGEYVLTLNGSEIDYSGDVIEVSNYDDYDFYAGSDAELFMIVGDGVDELLDDDNADYEVSTYSSAKNLSKAMDDYYAIGTLYVVADDDDSETIVSLYLYVSDVTSDKADANSDSAPADITITVDGDEVTDFDEEDTIADLDLENDGTYVYVQDGDDAEVGYYAVDSDEELVDGYTYTSGYVAVTLDADGDVSASSKNWLVEAEDYVLYDATSINFKLTVAASIVSLSELKVEITDGAENLTGAATTTHSYDAATEIDVDFDADKSGDDIVIKISFTAAS